MSHFTISRPSRRRAAQLCGLALVAATALALTAPLPSSRAAGPPGGAEGVMCEPSDGNTFNLDATAGYIATPDGNSIYSWSYTASGRGFQLPGPTLCVDSGSRVTVVLHNRLREDTSILFSGQTGVTADGKPAQPQTDGAGNLTSVVDPASRNGGTVTYRFTAGAPGTYLYSSGTDVTKQREMGLYGGLIVRPAGDPTRANSEGSSTFDTGHEYLYLLSQIDPALHLAVERNRAYAYSSSTARYFLINGRSMPDTLAPNNAAWLPGQPYGGLVHIRPASQSSAPALIRYLNAGSVSYPFHPHGSSQVVITRDGVPARAADGSSATFSKFLIDAGPGQSVDTTLKWFSEYDSATNPIPSDIELPHLQDQIVGPGTETWFSENPYLGGAKGDVPTGVVQNNQCGEYYHVAHSHALQQATNYGASFGGMMTLIRIDPPTGCQ